MTIENSDSSQRLQQRPTDASKEAALRAMLDFVNAAAHWAAVRDKKGLFGKPKGPPAEAKMRTYALTAVAMMHRSGLVTIQPEADDPLGEISTMAINVLFGTLMRGLSRPPRGWMIETPIHRRIIQEAVVAFRGPGALPEC